MVCKRRRIKFRSCAARCLWVWTLEVPFCTSPAHLTPSRTSYFPDWTQGWILATCTYQYQYQYQRTWSLRPAAVRTVHAPNGAMRCSLCTSSCLHGARSATGKRHSTCSAESQTYSHHAHTPANPLSSGKLPNHYGTESSGSTISWQFRAPKTHCLEARLLGSRQ